MAKPDDTQYLWLKSYPQSVKWDAELPVHPVHELLEKTVRSYADNPAFNFLGKKWNWQEIGFLVNRMASGLQQYGIQKGQRVGIFLPNSPYFLISYYAILKIGATVVNYNPLYADRELEHQIEDSETDFMVTVDLELTCKKLETMLRNTRLQKIIICPFVDILPFPKNTLFKIFKRNDLAHLDFNDYKGRYIDFGKLINNKNDPHHIDIDPSKDVAVLQYTGGTTGVPKGACLTHKNVVSNVEQAGRWFYKAKQGEEKMLGVLPFFHVFAMTAVMNMAVRNAFEIIALPRFDLDDTLKLIDAEKPQYFPAVPAIYSAINNHKKRDKYDLSSLEYCISGGAPLPVDTKQSFENVTGCVVVEGYGLTESSPVVCVNPIEGKNKAGSIGLPLPGTIIELINPEDHKSPVKLGERGELCVRGPQVMKGYWNKPDETEGTMINGRLHTGDIAEMDEEGYVYIVDRIKDLIITNGYNVYPRHVEEAIYMHPSVEECIVAGIPDKSRGEIVKAWIKIKDGRELPIDDLKLFLEDKISKIEIPKRFEIRDTELPKTMIGKLSRKDVIKEEQEGV